MNITYAVSNISTSKVEHLPNKNSIELFPKDLSVALNYFSNPLIQIYRLVGLDCISHDHRLSTRYGLNKLTI